MLRARSSPLPRIPAMLCRTFLDVTSELQPDRKTLADLGAAQSATIRCPSDEVLPRSASVILVQSGWAATMTDLDEALFISDQSGRSGSTSRCSRPLTPRIPAMLCRRY